MRCLYFVAVLSKSRLKSRLRYFAACIVQFGSNLGIYDERAGLIGLPHGLQAVDSLLAVYGALLYIGGNGTVGYSCFISCERFDSD